MLQQKAKLFANINAGIRRNQVSVNVPFSKQSYRILQILRDEGFINSFVCFENYYQVWLKYFEKRPVLKQIVSVSRQGRKVFTTLLSLKLLISKLSVNKFSKNFLIFLANGQGIVTHHQAFRNSRGGKIIAIAYI